MSKALEDNIGKEFIITGGRINFPYVSEPDDGRHDEKRKRIRKFPADGKYKVDYLIPEALFKKDEVCKKLKKACVLTGRVKLDRSSAKFPELLGKKGFPLKDGNARIKGDKYQEYADTIVFCAKNPMLMGVDDDTRGIAVVGPDGQQMTDTKEIGKLFQSGAYCTVVVKLLEYDDGVTLGLQGIRYDKKGESFAPESSQEESKALSMLSDAEVDVSDVDLDDEDDLE